MFFNNNLADTTSGYPIPDDNSLEFNDYPLEATNGGFNLDGLSAAEIEAWWLAPKPDGNAGQYSGSTLLEFSGNNLAGSHDTQSGQATGTSGVTTDEVNGFNMLGNESTDAPERAGPSTGLYTDRPAQLPLPPLATFTGPIAPPVPTLSWGYSPLPTETYTCTGNDWSNVYSDQPPAVQNLYGQWPHPTSVGKGNARATDDIMTPIHPITTGNTVWQYQQPYDYDPNPRTDAGVQDPDLFIQAAPSTGPQRSMRRAKEKEKEIDKGEGRRKRASKKDLAPGINWPNTCERFCAEMAKIYFGPTGEVTDPETAYARMTKFVKDDLYLSPLVVKPLGERQTRDLEQYLTGVLNELCPRTGRQKRGVRYMLERVTQELENGLVVVNDDCALLEGPPNEIDPGELDASEMAAERRAVEQGRREAIRGSLERMTLFFRRPEPGYFWSRPQVLFYAITYLVFGAGVSGDGGGFFTPKPQL